MQLTIFDPNAARSLDLFVQMNLQAASLREACQALLARMIEVEAVTAAQGRELAPSLEEAVSRGAQTEHYTAILQVPHPTLHAAALVRLREPLIVGDEDEVWFIWLLLSSEESHDRLDTALEFAHLLHREDTRGALMGAKTARQLLDVYQDSVEREINFEAHIAPELRPTGRFAGGLVNDIRRRLPHYVSDYTDGLNSKSIASILFLFFACLAPAIAFGGLLAIKTNNEIGIIEMIVATALCGVTYALTSGQPLTILGSTGPVIIFMGILYGLCESFGVPFLPSAAWVALWTMVFLLIMVVTDASSLIRYFTRFTDETFAALIAIIFVYEAVYDVVHVFQDEHAATAKALLSLNLALGTFLVTMALKQFRSSNLLFRTLRDFLADFGPAIAIALMTVAAFAFPDVELDTLQTPDTIQTTSGRAWLVNPLDAPRWVWGASMVPAALVSILLYLDQNITVRLVNSPENRLKKGAGYHLDLALVAVLVGVCGLLGLPWMVAATVRSLNHVNSLATTKRGAHGREVVDSVVETRVTGLGVHLLVGASLLLLPTLRLVPMSVLFGLFLYMGIAAMGGNQLFERLRLWFTDPRLYPPTSYLRAVPRPVVHTFTAVQAACLAVLWVVKTSAFGILFPLFIGLLVPVRMLMARYFDHEHLALLDAEEEPQEELDREGA